MFEFCYVFVFFFLLIWNLTTQYDVVVVLTLTRFRITVAIVIIIGCMGCAMGEIVLEIEESDEVDDSLSLVGGLVSCGGVGDF